MSKHGIYYEELALFILLFIILTFPKHPFHSGEEA